MKTNTTLWPVIPYADVDVLSIIEVKNPRKTHTCHDCGQPIIGRHVKVAILNWHDFFEIRECMNCLVKNWAEYDEGDGVYGTILIKEES